MSDYESVPIEIDFEGEIIITDRTALVWKKADDIMLVLINCVTKRGCIESTFWDGETDTSGFCVEAIDGSININESKKGEWTSVSFPTLKGWSVHIADMSKYTISVCLIRND